MTYRAASLLPVHTAIPFYCFAYLLRHLDLPDHGDAHLLHRTRLYYTRDTDSEERQGEDKEAV